jgi:amidase
VVRFIQVVVADTFPGDEKTIDRNVYLNSKLSIQVIAPRLQDRRLYQAMSFIDDVLQSGQPTKAKL